MNESANKTGAIRNIPSSRFRLFVWIQISIAVVTIIVSLFAGIEIASLVKRDRLLQKQIEIDTGKLKEVRSDLTKTRKEATRSAEELAGLQKILNSAADLTKFTFPIDFMDAKALMEKHEAQGWVLLYILKLKDKGVHWKTDGNDLKGGGFDSPGFASFILKQATVFPFAEAIEHSNGLSSRQATLMHSFFDWWHATNQPQIGDLVFYKSGYCMFYFENQFHRPFVIGMTPFGIISLEVSFADLISYGRIDSKEWYPSNQLEELYQKND